MNHQLWKILFVLALASAAFMLGCSDEDNGGGTAPTPRVVGVWDADSVSVDSHGVQQITYYFYNDYTYRYLVDGPPVWDERGSWTFAGLDSITFNADSLADGTAYDTTYVWRYDIVEGGTQASDVLHVWIFVDPAVGPDYYINTVFPRTQ